MNEEALHQTATVSAETAQAMPETPKAPDPALAAAQRAVQESLMIRS